MSTRRPSSLLVTTVVAMLGLLTVSGVASAQTTIGELAPASSTENLCTKGPADVVAAGPSVSTYTVPTAGVITSWSTQTASGAGQELTFKVFRSAGAGVTFPKFTVVGQAGPQALVPETVNTFATEIPVMAGDLIGVNDDNAESVPNSCVFRTTNVADAPWAKKGEVPVGETFEAEGKETATKVNVSATILAAPTISDVSPSKGPASGGTAITIGGSEFAHVNSVSVGTTSVPFNVASETSITATTPAGTAGAGVPVTVTTIAGSASSTFTYEGAPIVTVCTVPKLKGKKLKAARKTLGKAHCKLGKVTKKKGVTAKQGKVVTQKPKPGTKRSVGSKVSVKLG